MLGPRVLAADKGSCFRAASSYNGKLIFSPQRRRTLGWKAQCLASQCPQPTLQCLHHSSSDCRGLREGLHHSPSRGCSETELNQAGKVLHLIVFILSRRGVWHCSVSEGRAWLPCWVYQSQPPQKMQEHGKAGRATSARSGGSLSPQPAPRHIGLLGHKQVYTDSELSACPGNTVMRGDHSSCHAMACLDCYWLLPMSLPQPWLAAQHGLPTLPVGFMSFFHQGSQWWHCPIPRKGLSRVFVSGQVRPP